MSDGAQGERRFCPACGEPAAGDAFCTRCGARIAPMTSAPPASPVQPPPPSAPAYVQPPATTYTQPPAATYTQPPAAAYAQPPAATYTQPSAAAYAQGPVPAYAQGPAPGYAPGPAPVPAPPRKRHGCLLGCLVALLVPLLACGGLAAYLTLRPSAAEDVLGAPPDEQAAVTLTDALAERGIPTASAEVWVFPMSDGSGSVAYCTVDLAQASGDAGQPMPEYFVALGASDAARDAGITRVVLEIVDSSGQMLAVTTTDAASCAAYADGSLDYEGFLATLDGRVGPGMVTMWLGE